MYKTWMSTPAIDISGRTTDKIFISFNSSWRPYFEGASNTEIYINLSYDGGDPVQILNWVSDPNSEKYHGDNQNEFVVSLPIRMNHDPDPPIRHPPHSSSGRPGGHWGGWVGG